MPIGDDLVSVIMPAYNCEKFIGAALDSVLAQTYENWEAIVVDDCSTDGTGDIVKFYASREPRIKYYRLEANCGTAVARNKAVEAACGRYIAFLDSDDLWEPEKLRKQVRFMKEHGYTFTCTSYRKIDEFGNDLNRIIRFKTMNDYDDILKTSTGNSTVMYDAEKLGKFQTPNIRKRNDYALWLRIVRKSGALYSLDEPLASHRVRRGSLSSNKLGLISYQWQVYRQFEKLSLFKSIYLLCHWGYLTLFRILQRSFWSEHRVFVK